MPFDRNVSEQAAAAERVTAKRTARVMRREMVRAALDGLTVGRSYVVGEPIDQVTFKRDQLYAAIEQAIEAVEHAHQLPASSAFLVVGEVLLAAKRA